MMHSIKVTEMENSMSNFTNNANYSYQQIQQLPQPFLTYPPYYFPNFNSEMQQLSQQINNQNNSKKIVPNMKEFLEELDRKFGNEKFTCFLSAFEEQEIYVNQLTKLTDQEYISMGVTIIGRRQILRDESKKFE